MAVIQYETIEHLNLKELDIVGQAFPVTSVLQQRDFYERVFSISENMKKIFEEQLRFSDVSNNCFGWAS